LIKAYGKIWVPKINLRLDDLQAAANLQEFKTLPGRCHELKGERKTGI
jgi:hypothetical protein